MVEMYLSLYLKIFQFDSWRCAIHSPRSVINIDKVLIYYQCCRAMEYAKFGFTICQTLFFVKLFLNNLKVRLKVKNYNSVFSTAPKLALLANIAYILSHFPGTSFLGIFHSERRFPISSLLKLTSILY